MARYIREQILNQPEDFVQFMMNDFVTKHGFRQVEFKGEIVYRAGKGLLEFPKFLKWNYQNGVFHLEAWVRNLWLPGVYGKENAMTGYVGCIPKNAYKGDIDQLIGLLYQNVTRPDPAPQAAPAYVQGVDTSRYANIALALGIVGLVLSCLPYIGILFGILGIVYGLKGQNSMKKGRATAGFVCGLIGLIIGILVAVISILYLL